MLRLSNHTECSPFPKAEKTKYIHPLPDVPASLGIHGPAPFGFSSYYPPQRPNFHAWLRLFDAALQGGYSEELLSLIHWGLKADLNKHDWREPDYPYFAPQKLYLYLSDGWCDGYLFDEIDKNGISLKCSAFPELQDGRIGVTRSFLAQKAFDAFVLNVFVNKDKLVDAMYVGDRFKVQPGWLSSALWEHGLLDLVMRFFTPYRGGVCNDVLIRNIPLPPRGGHRHTTQLLLDFLRYLVGQIWDKNFWIVDKESQLLKQARLWSIDIIAYLDLWYVLSNFDLSLNATEHEKIKQIVLSNDVWAPDGTARRRQVLSVEEAFALGSKSAAFLVQYSARILAQKSCKKEREALRRPEGKRGIYNNIVYK